MYVPVSFHANRSLLVQHIWPVRVPFYEKLTLAMFSSSNMLLQTVNQPPSTDCAAQHNTSPLWWHGESRYLLQIWDKTVCSFQVLSGASLFFPLPNMWTVQQNNPFWREATARNAVQQNVNSCFMKITIVLGETALLKSRLRKYIYIKK